MYPNRSSYRTQLTPDQERNFQIWFTQMKSDLGRDLDPDDPTYDMRGFWRAMQLGAPGPQLDPNSGEIHFPDTFKTPLHPTMSAESIYAPQGAPTWDQGGVLRDVAGQPTLGYIQELLRSRQ
jgi:hypothetical protein